MTKYNWDERHIITFPEKELALETKDLHVYYGQKEAIKGIAPGTWASKTVCRLVRAAAR